MVAVSIQCKEQLCLFTAEGTGATEEIAVENARAKRKLISKATGSL